jgi:hypothetical protein
MKKLTAVQWLIHQLITENEVSLKGENYKLFELAKAMEKEQIIDAYKEGCFDNILSEKTDKIRAEQYYNETFKK